MPKSFRLTRRVSSRILSQTLDLDTPRFKRTRENFVCANCGQEVKGDGYTNHCPRCLWSKHVDVWPGDRAETCQGLMEPVAVNLQPSKHTLTHRCMRCKEFRSVKVAKLDDREAIISLMRFVQ